MIAADRRGSVAPPPAAPEASRGALGDFLADIDHLFWLPAPMPAPADRARALADSIDWSQSTVVIWVPGTNDHAPPQHVLDQLRAAGGPSPYTMDYASTWQLRSSVADGEATLRELLRLVAQRKRPGQRVVLIGESQGAWVISSVLRDPVLGPVVDRASLVAHPALAPAHVHPSTSTSEHLDAARIHEFNHDGDVVTREVGRSHDRVLDVVDSFASLRIGHALAAALGILVTDPGLIQALVGSQLFRVSGQQNPHASTDIMHDAVGWILGA